MYSILMPHLMLAPQPCSMKILSGVLMDKRIREVEHATFTPIVMSAMGGLASKANTFYQRLALLLFWPSSGETSTVLLWDGCGAVFVYRFCHLPSCVCMVPGLQ